MLSLIRRNVVDLPTNFSLSYAWCGGFMLSVFMFIQILSGIILSFLYVADESFSFECVLGFIGESEFLWYTRYCHVWGVTFIFILFGVHMGRSLYYGSHYNLGVWNVGFLLYLSVMVEAFLGYILPWHQMSYWAATVLTSILDSVPVVGSKVYSFIVGGFGVTNETLVRVFSAHVCFAFVIVGLILLHFFYLHRGGSNTPVSATSSYGDVVYFHPLFTLKDGFALFFLLTWFAFFIWVSPDAVLDVESYIEADPMTTPASIKPEWYFLPYYAMLRCVESKVGGLVLVLIFLFLLWFPSPRGVSCAYCVLRQSVFWVCVALFVFLGFLGACPPEVPYASWSQCAFGVLLLFMGFFKFFYVSAYFGMLYKEVGVISPASVVAELFN